MRLQLTFRENLFNEKIIKRVFPDNLKPDITSVFKKDDPFDKISYRLVRVLPIISRIYEKLVQQEINNFIKDHKSPSFHWYRKGYNTWQGLVSLIEKWKTILDDKDFVGVVLMELSKVFDTLNHKPLLAKLNAYSFKRDSRKLINYYLLN